MCTCLVIIQQISVEWKNNDITSTFVYLPTKLNIKNKIKWITTGVNCTILKDINDDFVVFGDNTSGQLLLPTNQRYIKIPTIINKEFLIQKLKIKSSFVDINLYNLGELSLIIVFD